MDQLGYIMMGENLALDDALVEWKAYAARLKKTLRKQKEESVGQTAIKKAALAEIARLDPGNPLMRQEVRNDIFEKAVEEARKSGKLD